MTDKERVIVPETIGVKRLRTDQLQANPYNPRTLFDKAPLKTLQESIRHVGILVPLTVYQRGADGQFIILDGQRRWICAQALGLSYVPVNQITEPNLVQNIVTMFQIHKLREDWELMPTALKLGLLMNELEEKADRKLADLTGLDIAVVIRCKKLLSYQKEFQELMLDPNPDNRVKADFFIELFPFLHDRVVSKLSGFSNLKLTKKMLEKYQNPKGGIKSVTDFRKAKQYVTNARKAGVTATLKRRLNEFINNTELTPEHLLIPEADVSAQARSTLIIISKAIKQLNELDIDAFVGEEKLWTALESLLASIRNCLRAAGRRIKE